MFKRNPLIDRYLRLEHVESAEVKPDSGIVCDVYRINRDVSKDIAVVTMPKLSKTPRQRVREGEATIEIYLGGRGRIRIEHSDGSVTEHDWGPELPTLPVKVEIGEVMQIFSHPDDELVFAEICKGPFTPGRFEELPDLDSIDTTI